MKSSLTMRRFIILAIVNQVKASFGRNRRWCKLVFRPRFFPESLLSTPDSSQCYQPFTARAQSGCFDFMNTRGGSLNDDTRDSKLRKYLSESEDDKEERKQCQRLNQEDCGKRLKYRTEQYVLYQLRSTYLSEMLASRGLPLPTVTGVAMADGDKPAEKVDWDCAMSTTEDPKSCLYSFDAEPDTKVVAPIGTEQWISLSALNRLRRTDSSKVEPMWHSRYAILQSWFSDASEFSMLQHVGLKGFLISSLLLDAGGGLLLRALLLLSLLSILILVMPVLEYIVGRVLTCAPFWAQWPTWGRVVRAGFPLKLLLGQLAWKGVALVFSKIESEAREHLVDLECEILEESIPLTLGQDSGMDAEENNVKETEETDTGGIRMEEMDETLSSSDGEFS